MSNQSAPPLVGIVMGSISDWETMKAAAEKLTELGIPYERRVLSAHRTPGPALEYAHTAADRGLRLLIAAAGGAAHLAGVMASSTILPVIGCPMMGWSLNGLDSLLSTVNMPGGIPVLTMGIGKPGAVNAALAAAAILALNDSALRDRLQAFREKQTQSVLNATFPD